MGEYINITDRINEINKTIETNNDKIKDIMENSKELYDQRVMLYGENNKLRNEKQALLATLNQSEIAFKFISKHEGYTYVGKMNSPQHGFVNCNKCLVSLELFKGNTGLREIEIGVCPKCNIEINFTDYSKW